MEQTTATAGPDDSGDDTGMIRKPVEFVVVSVYWDEWSRCIGSRYQKDQLYRLGRLDTCSRQWKDFRTAAKAKVVQWKDPKSAEDLINSTFYKKRTTISPTAGAVWELKENPGWE
jgi:hypothetical protein